MTTSATWRRCRKVTPTIAQRLTQDDFHQRGGIIQTLEGSASFNVNDYLAYDAKGEYPMTRNTLESGNYLKMQDLPDEWASYQPCDNIRYAMQVQHPYLSSEPLHRGEHLT